MNSYLRFVCCAMVMFITEGMLLSAQAPQVRAELHWSERATVVAPDKQWQINVSPKGEDGPASVSISQVISKRRAVLFRLERDASLLWNPNSSSVIIVDKEFSDRYRLMIFHTPFFEETESKGLAVDRTVRAAVEKTLSPSEHINYYLPDVVGWRDDSWLVVVGVKVLHGESGPFASHCLGYLVNSSSLNITQSFTDQELKRNYKVTCQM